jgi:hypothetical protein
MKGQPVAVSPSAGEKLSGRRHLTALATYISLARLRSTATRLVSSKRPNSLKKGLPSSFSSTLEPSPMNSQIGRRCCLSQQRRTRLLIFNDRKMLMSGPYEGDRQRITPHETHSNVTDFE